MVYWIVIKKPDYPYLIEGKEMFLTTNAYELRENDKFYLSYKNSKEYEIVTFERD